MSDDLEKLPRDYRKTLRVIAAAVMFFGPPAAYVYAMGQKIDAHLAKAQPFECAVAQNIYRLCTRAGETCEPVPAYCEKK